LMTQQARLYDQAKGGKQKFPVYVVPAAVVDATIERKEPVERAVAGKDLKFERYAYSLGGTDVTLWIEPAGKLVFADVPAQHAAFVREGYEILGKTPETDPLLSTAKYEVKTEHDVGVPMRDGVKLLTDVYRPQTSDKCPV